MIKTYISKCSFSLLTSVFVGDKECVVEFENGVQYPIRRNGIFSTDSKQLQDAIESSSGYNVKYELLKSHRVIEESSNEKSVELKNIEGIKSKQSAIEWVRINLKKEFSPATDSLLIKEFAKDNGIIFNNWR